MLIRPVINVLGIKVTAGSENYSGTKEWKGLIEKEFTIVHYADMRVVDSKRKYKIILNSDGKSSAKTPPMFLAEGQEEIENDYIPFINRMNEILNK